jgi:hypothetical protein
VRTNLARGPKARLPRAAELPAAQPRAGQGTRPAVFPATSAALKGRLPAARSSSRCRRNCPAFLSARAFFS